MAGRVEVRISPPYPVVVGTRLDIGETVSEVLEPGIAAILTDSGAGPLHAGRVRRELEAAGWRVADVIEVPAGERSKSLSAYGDVLRALARCGITRDGTLFALGGGVVGDLGGFAAASYMRGIGLVMLPTTLLSMVDSSVGGKTGIDLPEGKNLVGAFLQPRLVAADLEWLDTLPAGQVSNGLAEVIKMGLLSGGEFFEDLERVTEACEGDPDALQRLVLHSVRFKAGVVAEDELERGRRAILNYGHTVGHALEATAGYALPHGEAVSVGMVAAARLSSRRFGADLIKLHESLLSAAGLPIRAPDLDAERVVSAMAHDKKRRSGDGVNRFVLLEAVGRPVWGVPVRDAEVRRLLGELR